VMLHQHNRMLHLANDIASSKDDMIIFDHAPLTPILALHK
jgi:hypothetical protein